MESLVHGINDENFYECIEVSKEIFWMYYDIITTNCIMHGVDYEKVEFDKYIMCEIVEGRLKTDKSQDIVKLVCEGCFTALCCHVLIIMEENLNHDKVFQLIKNMLNEKKIEEKQFEKETLTIMHDMLSKRLDYLIDKNKYWIEYPEGRAFIEKLDEVYKKFVLGHYQSMLKE